MCSRPSRIGHGQLPTTSYASSSNAYEVQSEKLCPRSVKNSSSSSQAVGVAPRTQDADGLVAGPQRPPGRWVTFVQRTLRLVQRGLDPRQKFLAVAHAFMMLPADRSRMCSWRCVLSPRDGAGPLASWPGDPCAVRRISSRGQPRGCQIPPPSWNSRRALLPSAFAIRRPTSALRLHWPISFGDRSNRCAHPQPPVERVVRAPDARMIR